MSDEKRLTIQTYESPWPPPCDHGPRRSWLWRVYNDWKIRRALRGVFIASRVRVDDVDPKKYRKTIGGFTVPKEKR